MKHFILGALAIGASSLVAGCFVDANTTPPPACNDGLDNDHDGKVDFPSDPGCTSLNDDTETDPLPTAACSDGVDNDGDGRTDFPNDPGCSSVNDTTESDGSPAGRMTVTWQLQDWNDTTKQPKAAACPAGGDTAVVYSLPAGLTSPSQALKDLFNCADGSGTTAGLDPGSYTVWVEITSHDGAVLYAQSLSTPVAITSNSNVPETFAFQVNRGYIAGSWSLNHSNGTPADCTNVTGIDFVDTDTATNGLVTDQFNCPARQGTTYPLPLSTYNVSVEALGKVNNVEQQIGQAGLVTGVPVQFGNDLKNIGSVVITLDPGF